MLTPTQKRAVRALELAFQGLARSKMVMVSIDDALIVTVDDDELEREMRHTSSCGAILQRDNRSHPGTAQVNHHRVFLSGGGA